MTNVDTRPPWAHTKLFVSERETIELGETEHYYVDLLQQVFGTADLVLTPKDAPQGWDAGWYYRTLDDALSAAWQWQDPEHTAPGGWQKAVGVWPRVEEGGQR